MSQCLDTLDMQLVTRSVQVRQSILSFDDEQKPPLGFDVTTKPPIILSAPATRVCETSNFKTSLSSSSKEIEIGKS